MRNIAHIGIATRQRVVAAGDIAGRECTARRAQRSIHGVPTAAFTSSFPLEGNVVIARFSEVDFPISIDIRGGGVVVGIRTVVGNIQGLRATAMSASSNRPLVDVASVDELETVGIAVEVFGVRQRGRQGDNVQPELAVLG